MRWGCPVLVLLLWPTAALAAEPATIEQAGQAYLERAGAPAEVADDWRDFADRTGTEVWNRPGLTRAQRSLITIAMLSVLREPDPLRVHIEAGLANGLTRREIAEAIMHTAVYAGVPQALRSMQICREVYEALDAQNDG
jgi:alkylhydroperoxidase/carboxymuconolactone decarboxylase family protein YurZ